MLRITLRRVKGGRKEGRRERGREGTDKLYHLRETETDR